MARVQVEHHHTGAAHIEGYVCLGPAPPPLLYLAGVGRGLEDAASAFVWGFAFFPIKTNPVGVDREDRPASFGVAKGRLEDCVAIARAQWGFPVNTL